MMFGRGKLVHPRSVRAQTMNPPSSPPTLEFHRRESVRDGIHRLTRDLAEAALAQGARPAAEQESAIHVMRLTLKRARALVRLLKPSIPKGRVRPLETSLRQAARRLAEARDTSVGQTTLDELVRDASEHRRAALHKVRTAYRHTHPANPARTSGIATALRGAARAQAGLSRTMAKLPDQPWGWSTLEAGLRASYRRARRRFRAAHTDSSESSFHRWRIAVKTLQYQVALLRQAHPKRIGLLVKRLDDLAGTLGREHDLAVLARRLNKSADRFGGRAVVRVALEISTNRQQALRKQALKLGRRIFTVRPPEFVASLHRLWRTWRDR